MMSDKRWNENQEKAITIRHKNILVSASAGSGKTGVLIQRLVDLVTKDKIELNQILAMTFTNAAAAEMKKRLSSEITKLVELEQDPNELVYLKNQLTQCTTAHISTIHSFCLSILQNYYYVINCSLKRVNTILDTPTQTMYQQMALAKVLNEQNTLCDQAFIDLNLVLSPRPEEKAPLENLIVKVSELASAQVDPHAWLMKALSYYETKSSIRELDPKIAELFFDYLNSQVNAYLECLDIIKNKYLNEYANEEKKAPIFMNKIQGVYLIQEALAQRDFNALRNAFITLAKIVVPTPPSKEDDVYINARKQSQEIEDNFVGFYPEQTYLDDLKQMYPLVRKCIDCVLAYLDEYEKIKVEHECIDFGDMEHLALAILQANNGEVASIYRELFKEIMVDEFQDSNDVQDQLVQLICKENNVFRVGDVKQSIYGFRHALPSIMQSYKLKQDKQNECIIFRKNYRSSETIVEFNNVLYERLMNVEGFKSLPFMEEDLVGIGGAYQQKVVEPIMFHALSIDAIEKDVGIKIQRDDFKASYIANQILEIKEKYGYQFKDFVVLVRGNAKMDVLKKVFDEIHLPFYMESKHGFYSSKAIQIMLSTLRCFVNPKDDLNFVAMLTSPYFAFTSEQLVELKLAIQEKEHYVDVFCRLHPALYDTFTEIRKSSMISISKCISECLKWNAFYDDYCTLQDQTNLDLLFEKALNYEKAQGSSVSGFLISLSQIQSEETAEASAIGKDADVVRFMSIHQSKGLEFPVVFLWGSSNMKDMNAKEAVMLDSDFGLGFRSMMFPSRLTRSTLIRMAIEHKLNRESLEEEMRILYVATTRAKDQMHIVDYVSDVNVYMAGLSQSKIYARKGTSSWILGALMNLEIPHLFRVMNVHRHWSNKTQEEVFEQDQELPIYRGECHSVNLATASSGKVSKQPIAIDFSQKKQAMSVGNIYHKMIETLPASIWDKELILQVADENKIPLKPFMIQPLLQLSQNVLYQSTFTFEEIYHEFPFQVTLKQECIHGFMDYVAIHDQSIVLIDFKSDINVTETTLHELYDEQLLMYMKAIGVLYPSHQVQAYLYSLHLNQMIEVMNK